ncbi:Holliday junction resolvase RuvX [Paraburkholderia sp.]|uniref:Holliday junction resolvase RuvX n=1 Tax=Paraburkholderia sp. TaxID=1926495 RepID=UPI00239DD9E6|nr:Holliday junction resolvase RuvX [Paraburkholderia sp.]MDE1183009.1 Holliday junction resolvase RuvX [Paraburkholderia sp.]
MSGGAGEPGASGVFKRDTTLLGFDYGEKRIGVAVGNSLTRSARPLVVVPNRNREYRFEAVGKLIDEWKPDALVVGLPMHPDGTPHERTQLAKRFGNQLNGRFNLPVTFVDERYSSVEAEAGIRAGRGRAEMLDAEAASIILQQYLDGLSDNHEFH